MLSGKCVIHTLQVCTLKDTHIHRIYYSTTMHDGILPRWKLDPLKCNGFPLFPPTPFSPVHNARKFSAVLGTTSARNSISILPRGLPPIEISKNTTGLESLILYCRCDCRYLLECRVMFSFSINNLGSADVRCYLLSRLERFLILEMMALFYVVVVVFEHRSGPC